MADAALLAAAKTGDLAAATRARVDGASLVCVDGDGGWPLLWAVFEGHAELVRYLLAEGTNVNMAADRGPVAGCTALIISAMTGHETCTTLLLQAGADKDKAKYDGVTPLFMSAQKGHEACLTLLLQAGADVDKADVNGVTPLFISAYNDQLECARLLLLAGANTTLVCAGKTALQWAEKRGHSKTATLLYSPPPRTAPLLAAETRLALATSCDGRLGDGSLFYALPLELLACIAQHVQRKVLCFRLEEARMVMAFLASCVAADEPSARICLDQACWDVPLAIERFLAPLNDS